MISTWHFTPVVPWPWLVPAALLMLVLFAWQESRKTYRFKAARVLAQVLAVLSILGLLLRPSLEVNDEVPELIVVTPDYSAELLDSLRRAEKEMVVVRMTGVGGLEGKADSLVTYRQLERKGVVRFVLGSGIPLPYLETVRENFHFLPGPPPGGIVGLDITPHPEHRRTWLTGKTRGAKGTRLVLTGPGGVEDSLVVRTDALSTFKLQFTTKVAGRYVYRLATIDRGGRETVEEVPVEVVAGRRLRVLLLQAYPTAEVRFLKNYLTAKGHLLVTRYQVSKNIFRYEVVNGATPPEGGLDARELVNFDLVIADNESFERCSFEELRVLEEAARNGLGVLELLNDIPDARTFPGKLLQLSPVTDAPDTIRYSLGSFGSFTSPFVAVEGDSKVQVISQASGMLLQGLILSGDGKVAVQALRETYRLALSGDNSVYAALWAPLLEQSARREEGTVKVHVTSAFPVYPDEPVEVEAVGPETLRLTVGGVPVPLTEDLQADDLWRGKVWIPDAGWSEVKGSDYSGALFIARHGAWPSIRAEVQRQANALVKGDQVISRKSSRREEVNPIFFFLIFLLSAGFIWLSPKL